MPQVWPEISCCAVECQSLWITDRNISHTSRNEKYLWSVQLSHVVYLDLCNEKYTYEMKSSAPKNHVVHSNLPKKMTNCLQYPFSSILDISPPAWVLLQPLKFDAWVDDYDLVYKKWLNKWQRIEMHSSKVCICAFHWCTASVYQDQCQYSRITTRLCFVIGSTGYWALPSQS